MTHKLFVSGLSLLLCLAFVGRMQGQVITATIYGVVADPSGAVIPNAKVTAADEQTGAKASTTTNAAGEFTLSSLQAGPYSITIEGSGFQTQKQTGLQLASGQRIRLTYTMQLGALAQAVEITAAAPLVNAVNAEQRTNLGALQVSELPSARRDWTNLIKNDTGISTVQGRVTLNGLASTALRLTVDGTDAASDSEMPAVSMYQEFNFIKGVSSEAIEEVNVAKSIASAEIGNTMSGNININTKRGTNKFHGSLFELNQTEDLNARNQFLTTKPGQVFNQFGGSFGGPAIRNKLFFFGVYEGYRLRGFQTFSGNVPTAEFRAQAIAAVPAYKPMLDLFPLPNTPVTPGAVTGLYRGAGSQVANENHAVIRSDYHLRDDTILTARYTRGRPFQQIPRLEALLRRDWTGVIEVGSLNVTHMRARWTSESRLGINHSEVAREDNSYQLGLSAVSGGVGFSTSGETFAKFGTSWSLEEVMGVSRGRHSLKFGGLFVRPLAGRENISSPSLVYANATDFLANSPNSVTVTFGVKDYQIRQWSLGFFVQDDFKVSRRLMLNMGIRYDYFEVPKERDGKLFNRDDPFGMGPYLPPDEIWKAKRTNLSPRIGFAYTLDGAGKTVVRGGAGIFFSQRPIYTGVMDIVQNALDEPFRITFSRADVVKYGALLQYPVDKDKVLPLVKGPQGVIGSSATDPNWGYPYSYQWTLGVQRQLSRNTVLEAAYVGNRGVKLLMSRFMDQPDRITGVRPNDKFTQFRYSDGHESSFYSALQVSLRRRFAKGLTANTNYTWSRLLSYTGEADMYIPGQPQDVFNIRADHGPADQDLTHRFTSDVIYELPFHRFSGSDTRTARLLLRGWQIGSIVTAQSGSPFNVTQSSGLNSSRADYIGGAPILSDSRQTLVYLNKAAFAQVPLAPVSRLPIRPGNIGRNALRGPGMWNVDLALSKSLAFMESMKLQIRADMLNAFNHTNLSGPSSDITSGTFGRITSTRGARVMQSKHV